MFNLTAEAPEQAPEKPDVLGVADLAGIFRVSEKTIWAWEAAGMPIIHRGSRGAQGDVAQFSFRACTEWYFSENYERLELDRQKTRVAEEQADKLALDNAETRGDVARISVMCEEVDALLGDHRKNALGLPSKAAPLLVGLNADQIRDRLERFINEVLDELADYRPGERKKGRTSRSS